MNWLAHLLLAESNVESRLGNLLGDLVKGKERDNLNNKLKQGLQCHQAIDIFTDKHPIVKCSKRRISSEYRRCSGIIIDVFYDYVLTQNWDNYCDVPLKKFISQIYLSFEPYLDTIPSRAKLVIQQAISEDWLTSYSSIEGIDLCLKRISYKLNKRTKRNFRLDLATPQLITNYSDLEADFNKFFPQLIIHIKKINRPITKVLKTPIE